MNRVGFGLDQQGVGIRDLHRTAHTGLVATGCDLGILLGLLDGEFGGINPLFRFLKIEIAPLNLLVDSLAEKCFLRGQDIGVGLGLAYLVTGQMAIEERDGEGNPDTPAFVHGINVAAVGGTGVA